MTLINVIALAIIVLAIVVGLFIVVRKFPHLAAVDVSQLPDTQAKTVKERIVQQRFERSVIAWASGMRRRFRPYRERLLLGGRRLIDWLVNLERSYRQKMLAKNPASSAVVEKQTEGLVAAGEDLLAEDDFDAAERKFIDAIALDPRNVDAYAGLGDLYWETGKLDQARETYEYILKLNADNFDASARLGNIALAQGNLAVARDYQLRSVELDSSAAVHYRDLAAVYQEMGELEEALTALQKAVGLEPNNPRYLDALIELCILSKRRPEAREALKRLREVNPENQKLEDFEKRIRRIRTTVPTPAQTPAQTETE